MKIKKWQIILISLVFFIVTPIFVYLLVCTPNPWGLGFIKPEDTGAWLGFYGAVLGGSITFGGVWWTIKSQNDETNKLKKLEYRPLLDMYNNSDLDDRTSFAHFYEGLIKPIDHNQKILYNKNIKIGLINNNPNPCIIDKIVLKNTNHGIEVLETDRYDVTNVYANAQQPIILNFKISIPKEIDTYTASLIHEKKGKLVFILEVFYSNIFDKNLTYKKIIRFETTIVIIHKGSSFDFKTINTNTEIEDYDGFILQQVQQHKNSKGCHET